MSKSKTEEVKKKTVSRPEQKLRTLNMKMRRWVGYAAWWTRPITITLLLTGFFVIASALFKILCGVVETFEVSISYLTQFWQSDSAKIEKPISKDPDGFKSAILLTLQGVEFFLLAPLPYLILTSLSKFVSSWSGTGAELEVRSRRQLEEGKSFLVTIIIGVLAIDFLGDSLKGGTSISEAAPQLIGLAILMGYFYMLHKIHVSDG